MQANPTTITTPDAWNSLWHDLESADAAYAAAEREDEEEAAGALHDDAVNRIWAAAPPTLEAAIQKLEYAIQLEDVHEDSLLHVALEDLRRFA